MSFELDSAKGKVGNVEVAIGLFDITPTFSVENNSRDNLVELLGVQGADEEISRIETALSDAFYALPEIKDLKQRAKASVQTDSQGRDRIKMEAVGGDQYIAYLERSRFGYLLEKSVLNKKIDFNE